MAAKHPHIIVVGTGIIGASLTYHLAKSNSQVTLVDKAARAANEVTNKSFAWIVAGYNETESYLRLRQQAISDWHRIENELNGQLRINWSGALTWLDSTTETESYMRRLRNFDSNVRLVEQPEMCTLEPNLRKVPAVAMFAEDEGAINPGLTTNLLIRAAQEAGATILFDTEVVSLLTKSSGVVGVATEKGNIKADVVVLATGTNTVSLCHPLNLQLPIEVSPSILMELHTTHRFVNHIVSNPSMEIRAASNTLTYAAEDYVDESIQNNSQSIAQYTVERIKEQWLGTNQLKLANIFVGNRPIPKDGLPIIGKTAGIEGLYLSVTHSGVTLAAILGRLAATEILTHQNDHLLSSYRPQRFG